MKYVALDIETGGLNPLHCSLLSIGMILDNGVDPINKLPTLDIRIGPPAYKDYSYSLSKWSIENLSGLLKDLSCRNIFESFDFDTEPVPVDRAEPYYVNYGESVSSLVFRWLMNFYDIGKPEKIVLAGKNIKSFDLPFLKEHGVDLDHHTHHRTIDPGSMFLRPEDTVPPSLPECMRRANLTQHNPHDALADCYDVVNLVRYFFLSRPKTV